MKTFKLYFSLIFVVGLVASCNPDEASDSRQYGIFQIQADGSTIVMDGTIESTALTDFTELQNDYADVNLINIKSCEGSADDEINLLLSARVHENGINTHLMDNGEIASGGVDFFLAGVKRTKGENTKIGVHSWAGGNETATDFPIGHANHLPYINYYVSVGFTQQQAEDFYYFTINAAPANAIHWMTDEEINRFQLVTE